MIHHLDLSLADDTKMQLKVYTDGISENGPVLLLFPAMGVEAAYYHPFAEAMAEQGVIVVTADIRGNGLSSVRPSKDCNFGYREMIELDYTGIFEAIYQRYPQQPKFVMGHSLGGQLACLFLSRYDFPVAGVILTASCSVHYKGWTGINRLRTFTAVHLFDPLVRLLGYFPGDKIGFGGRGAKNTLLDWCRQGRSGAYRLRGSDFDYEVSMKKLNVPVMAVTIEGDWLAPYKATENLYSKLHPESSIEHFVYSKAEAGFAKLNHFNWARKPQVLVEKIRLWMSSPL